MLKDINNWNKISVEVWKETLIEAKVRQNELLSQSETITGMLIKFLLAISALVAWSISNVFNNIICYKTLIIIPFSLLVIAFYLRVLTSFFPRKIPLRGVKPENIFSSDEEELSGGKGSENYSEDDKLRVFYYYQVIRYNKRITDIDSMLKIRAKQYKESLFLSSSLVLYVIIVLLFTSF